jgi:hypothetical protein
VRTRNCKLRRRISPIFALGWIGAIALALVLLSPATTPYFLLYAMGIISTAVIFGTYGRFGKFGIIKLLLVMAIWPPYWAVLALFWVITRQELRTIINSPAYQTAVFLQR